MVTIEFKLEPTADDKTLLIEQITQLSGDQSLRVSSPVSLKSLLEDFKKKRFQGLTWEGQMIDGKWQTEIKNPEIENCCGCCGGND